MCELNNESYLVKSKISTLKQFNSLIVFSQDERSINADDDEWNGFVDAIKKILTNYFTKMTEKISKSSHGSEERQTHIRNRLDL